MLIINLFGGPGSGKSTTAAGLFYKMKLSGYKCELVPEYAKELTYEGRFDTLDNQIYVFGKQLQRLERIKTQVDFAVTDSPILLGSIYAPPEYPDSFHELLLDIWDGSQNECFMINRIKEYQNYGRTQTEEQARAIDTKCKEYLAKHNIPYAHVLGNPEAPDKIMELLGMKNVT